MFNFLGGISTCINLLVEIVTYSSVDNGSSWRGQLTLVNVSCFLPQFVSTIRQLFNRAIGIRICVAQVESALLLNMISVGFVFYPP